jgi:hypothetical protein
MKQETLEEAAERILFDNTGMLVENHPTIKQSMLDLAKWQQDQNDTLKVTRVEVIQHSPPFNGRAYTNYNAKDVEIQLQDDGKTLKIFLK